MTIYKYPLEITDFQAVMMPHEAQILCVQIQRNEPCLWALVKPRNADKQARTIEIFGTGHPMDNQSRTYIGTIQQGDVLVWHIFERL